MPCKDSTSKVSVTLNADERLLDFDFSKITCSKPIASETGFKKYCVGLHMDEIAAIEFDEIVRQLAIEDEETQFFLYLEWDALRTALAQYNGNDDAIDTQRYQIASIAYDQDRIEISQVIHPLESMPKIIPCSKR